MLRTTFLTTTGLALVIALMAPLSITAFAQNKRNRTKRRQTRSNRTPMHSRSSQTKDRTIQLATPSNRRTTRLAIQAKIRRGRIITPAMRIRVRSQE